MMLLLGQRDSRWASKPIGGSKITIGGYGCTITNLAMLSDWYGCYHDPAWMAKYLRFTAGGLLLWQSVSEKLCFKFQWRQYGYNEKRIMDSLAGKTTSCILQIHGNHWVVGIKKLFNKYYIADPWTKTRRWIDKSEISGSAHFDR
jgi:ABC-type bacteriocin/lantibiotic exporter with double-glycine peptidase domain